MLAFKALSVNGICVDLVNLKSYRISSKFSSFPILFLALLHSNPRLVDGGVTLHKHSINRSSIENTDNVTGGLGVLPQPINPACQGLATLIRLSNGTTLSTIRDWCKNYIFIKREMLSRRHFSSLLGKSEFWKKENICIFTAWSSVSRLEYQLLLQCSGSLSDFVGFCWNILLDIIHFKKNKP